MIKTPLAILSAGALVCTADSLKGAIVIYDFNTENPPTASDPGTFAATGGDAPSVGSTITATAVDASRFELRNDDTFTNETGANADRVHMGVQGFTRTSANTNFNNGYVQFRLTPQVGTTFDLTSISLDAARGGSGTRGYTVRYSFDGFSSDAGFLAGDSGNLADNTDNFRRDTFGLTDEDAGLDETTSAVTFRLLGYTPSSTGAIRYDNITINGTVVPEPSSLMLLGLSGIALSPSPSLEGGYQIPWLP